MSSDQKPSGAFMGISLLRIFFLAAFTFTELQYKKIRGSLFVMFLSQLSFLEIVEYDHMP